MLLSLLLLAIGFIVGQGYHNAQQVPAPSAPNAATKSRKTALPPLVKGLRASPDDRLLAFTGVYEDAQHASRFLLDLKTGHFNAVESPFGWQDYITQWSPDSRSILFEREKIPRPVDEALPGIYQQQVQPDQTQPDQAPRAGEGESEPAGPRQAEPQLLTKNLAPNGERVIAGLRTPDAKLLVRTRRDPKAL